MHPYTAKLHHWKIPHNTVLNMICFLLTLSVFANAPEIRAETSDLVVDSVRVNNATLNPGDTFRLDTVIRNQGQVASRETTVRYYLSLDETISGEDTEIGTSALPSIRVNGTTESRMQFTAPDMPGTHYYGICIDGAANENDTTNNCSVGTAITVKGADLMIFDTPQISKTMVKAGETFQIETRVWNRGRVAASETTLRYYLSADENLSLEDTQVATDSVPSLLGRGSHASRRRADISKTLTAPETSGTHYYIVCVDTVAGDADTINNCSQAIAVTVEAPVPDPTVPQVSIPMTRRQGPDLVISAARVDAATIMLGGRCPDAHHNCESGDKSSTSDNDSVLPLLRCDDFRRGYRDPRREYRTDWFGQNHHDVVTPTLTDFGRGVLLRGVHRRGCVRI